MEALSYRKFESTGNSIVFSSLHFKPTYSLEEASHSKKDSVTAALLSEELTWTQVFGPPL